MNRSEALHIEHPPSYTDRLIEYIQTSGVSSDIANASIALIKSFRQQVAEDYKNRTEQKQEQNPNKITYGKYNGRTLQDIALIDKPYLVWVSRQSFITKNPEHLNIIKALIN